MQSPSVLLPQESVCLETRLATTRATTLRLVAGLSDADATVQSMDDASPAKWHLAHTTWFFEEFILRAGVPGYRSFDARYAYLFNSYYESVGARHPRPRRGLLTRPSLDEIRAYRRHVDDALLALDVASLTDGQRALLELGTHHEEQHQELLLTDILHLFAQNPLAPAWRSLPELTALSGTAPAARWIDYPGGIVPIGASGPNFHFDCEGPSHQVLLRPFRLADQLVTNREWCEFIDDGGYRNPLLWLSEGWARVVADCWQAPLYWRGEPGQWRQMTLGGERPLDPLAPVQHVAYFEADAYARWAGARLPTEFEWEAAARAQSVTGSFLESGRFRPARADQDPQTPLRQLYGELWQWTASAFLAYPGFRPAPGAVGEYNGKFMSGQFVLRGGSCATAAGHMRATYRNFFQPQQRWQFSGVRLAKDAHD